MNTQLVNSLVQLIQSLPTAERELLQKKLDKKLNWQTIKMRIIQRGEAIQERLANLGDDAIDEVFSQMREERSIELLQACLPERENP
ncbi:MAG: hypothetical protein SAL07_24635 [Oscillatoria sp. PMC 1051.18]|nr:hypothetical protein [Oscillatoria sp. PMC 1050.18]MEC5033097.1 hypothetical protein [Oscillatoria sp. PMC 1051.18]